MLISSFQLQRGRDIAFNQLNENVLQDIIMHRQKDIHYSFH